MIYKNQKGVSLVQILLVILAVVGLGYAFMQYSEKQNSKPKIVELKAEATEIVKSIRIRIGDKSFCDASFIGAAPGENLLLLRVNADPAEKPFAETGTKFQSYNVYIKEMRLLSRAEEITAGLRVATTNPISSFTTGASVSYLKVVMVKHLGVISDRANPQKFYGSKEAVETFPVNGFFFDTKIVTHSDPTKLKEACWANAATLGISCSGADQERCAMFPIDEDGDGPDYVVDAKTGAKVHLAECRYFRDDSPLMECAI